jgi:Predicted transcriptional regulator
MHTKTRLMQRHAHRCKHEMLRDLLELLTKTPMNATNLMIKANLNNYRIQPLLRQLVMNGSIEIADYKSHLMRPRYRITSSGKRFYEALCLMLHLAKMHQPL